MSWTDIMNMSKREINNKLDECRSSIHDIGQRISQADEIKITITLANDATCEDLKRVSKKLDELKYCIKDIKVSK